MPGWRLLQEPELLRKRRLESRRQRLCELLLPNMGGHDRGFALHSEANSFDRLMFDHPYMEDWSRNNKNQKAGGEAFATFRE